MRPRRKFISFSVNVDPLMVVSVFEMTVFVVTGSLTFPLVLRVVCICVVPEVRKVDIKLVDRSLSVPWLLSEEVWFGLGILTRHL